MHAYRTRTHARNSHLRKNSRSPPAVLLKVPIKSIWEINNHPLIWSLLPQGKHARRLNAAHARVHALYSFSLAHTRTSHFTPSAPPLYFSVGQEVISPTKPISSADTRTHLCNSPSFMSHHLFISLLFAINFVSVLSDPSDSSIRLRPFFFFRPFLFTSFLPTYLPSSFRITPVFSLYVILD